MMSITKLFLMVIRAFVSDCPIDPELKSQFTTDVLENLFDIAKAHDVVQIVSDVLFKNGLLPKGSPITEEYQKHQMHALYRYMSIEREQQLLYRLFEEKGVAFIPLKGAVIRQYYPDPYMRTSCDIDILVREEDLERAVQVLVSEMNYRRKGGVGYHDVSLFSQSGVHLELHYNLKEKRDNLDPLLLKVWDYSVDVEGRQYYKLQSPEFFVFHHMAHMVNHFLRGGCGMRTFIDLYFIQKRIAYDSAIVSNLMKECGIETFYHTALQCVDAWFGSAAATEAVDLMEAFVLKGGVYGTRENRLNIDQNKKGGKAKYLISRLFLPYNVLKYKYPILQKHKALLPLIWLFRIVSFVSPAKRERARKELQMQKGISETAEEATNRMLALLEI